MKLTLGILNTDHVNLHGNRFAASGLMRAEQDHYRRRQKRAAPVGIPLLIQHDRHRPVGWASPLGLYCDSEMVRELGLFEEAETMEETAELHAQASAFWSRHHEESSQDYRDDLVKCVAPADLTHANLLHLESAVVRRRGIAAELYPDLFESDSTVVDKDGLTDYINLIHFTKQVQPGVFHDKKRDLLLFAHPFFRRSLFYQNKLNEGFLHRFDALAIEKSGLRSRIRLDPDMLGHPKSLKYLIELEHWRGPQYDDDIIRIPAGVAEHKADQRTRFYQGIDRIQAWWKAPERRNSGHNAQDFRTFEIEELTEIASDGLGGEVFGCRYAHAEFSSDSGTIGHFEGAIRAYSSETYLSRIERSIDRAGKGADYTKLFRFDGALSVSEWKHLLGDFFHGNKLIPEYLGELTREDARPVETVPRGWTSVDQVPLAALVALQLGSINGRTDPRFLSSLELNGRTIPFIEIGVGEVGQLMRRRTEVGDIPMVSVKDSVLNLSPIIFALSKGLTLAFDAEVTELATALRHDAETGCVRRVAIPLVWEDSGLVVKLTVAGDVEKVVSVLERLPGMVDPSRPPSEWIEPLSEAIKVISPRVVCRSRGITLTTGYCRLGEQVLRKSRC